MLTWNYCEFEKLPVRELYQILKLRQDVFVIEQNCIYADMDDLDYSCVHLYGKDEKGLVKAYLRIIPPGGKRNLPSIGRIVVAPDVRGKKVAYPLVEEGIKLIDGLYPGMDLLINAQKYLEAFYTKLGFEKTSDMYLEDGIPHIDMVKKNDMPKLQS